MKSDNLQFIIYVANNFFVMDSHYTLRCGKVFVYKLSLTFRDLAKSNGREPGSGGQ
jgi:hypothetical protein